MSKTIQEAKTRLIDAIAYPPCTASDARDFAQAYKALCEAEILSNESVSITRLLTGMNADAEELMAKIKKDLGLEETEKAAPSSEDTGRKERQRLRRKCSEANILRSMLEDRGVDTSSCREDSIAVYMRSNPFVFYCKHCGEWFKDTEWDGIEDCPTCGTRKERKTVVAETSSERAGQGR